MNSATSDRGIRLPQVSRHLPMKSSTRRHI